MVKRETLSQDDGSIWQYYHTADGAVVLTSKGRELIHDKPDTLSLIHSYRQKCLGRIATGAAVGVRKHFRSGCNSDVYELAAGSGLVVKETTTTQSMYHALNRMDRLKSIIDAGGVPRWIDMPTHYGLVLSSRSDADYMLMEKIDAGVTVADVIDRSDEEIEGNPYMRKAFGPIGAQIRGEVSARFKIAKALLDTAIVRNELIPADYLPDWNSSNVLVERLETPIAGSNVMLWVIDQ